MSEFWIPRYKWEFVAWLSQNFPDKSWSHLTKKQLMAVYYKTRRAENESRTTVQTG